MLRRTLVIAVLVLTVVAAAPVADAAGAPKVSVPTVSGPVTGGNGYPTILTTNIDLADVGYESAEYFLEGTATSYQPVEPLREDGKWKVTKSETAPFKTRMVVYRPIDPKDFDGTAFVEWLNVSAGFDTSPDWLTLHTQIIRAGAAYVAVSAQAVGVQGGADVIPGASSGGLKGGDPARYGSLEHPGDAYSYDMYSQAGVAAAGGAKGPKPLGDLDVQRVIAMGESQSAFRLTTYVNAIHPVTGVYDGFFIHSRAGGSAGFGTTNFSQPDATIPKVVHTRTDVDVPVLTAQTETDLLRLGYLPSRQPDSKNFRLWEIAGTSHADQYTVSLSQGDTGDGTAELKLLDPANANGGVLSCATPINAGPAFPALNAGLFHLERWVRDGTPPPKAPRMESQGDELVRDEHGIVRGGIRSPIVDVPLATNTGLENSGGSFCLLFGTTAPFDAATLASLYPSHDAYVRDFSRSADRTVKAGFWLAPNAKNFKAAARQITFG
jgi:hypothetical protein